MCHFMKTFILIVIVIRRWKCWNAEGVADCFSCISMNSHVTVSMGLSWLLPFSLSLWILLHQKAQTVECLRTCLNPLSPGHRYTGVNTKCCSCLATGKPVSQPLSIFILKYQPIKSYQKRFFVPFFSKWLPPDRNIFSVLSVGNFRYGKLWKSTRPPWGKT